MKKILASPAKTVLLLMASATVIFAAVYPEILLTFKTSFIMWSDYCVEYAPSFILTNFLYQGGIQLWDFFGQMPYFHSFATLGFFQFPNVITAVLYYVISPFAENSAALFHHVYAWGQMITLLCIRVIGIYLLLSTVSRNRLLVAGSTVIFSVFFCPAAFLIGIFYRSYLPLEMYFIVRFFQTFQPRFLVAAYLFFVITLGNELLHAGYFYLPIHFFILSAVMWRGFEPFSKTLLLSVKKWPWKNLRWILGLTFLVLVPYAFILKFGFPDLYFGQADSRIGHPFSLAWYFQGLKLSLSSPASFFVQFLDLRSVDTYYIGISFIFLSLVGLLFNQKSIKWIFGLTVMFLWLLTFPKESLNLGSVAHLVNALTNPLKTLPRSYFNAFQAALPYILMPLAVMGLEVIGEMVTGRRISTKSLILLTAAMTVLLWDVVPQVAPAAGVYLSGASFFLMGALIWAQRRPHAASRQCLIGVVALMILVDVIFIVDQSKRCLLANFNIKPVVLDAAPQAGLVDLDFENPSIFPFRSTTLLHFSYSDEQHLWWPHSVSSDFNHVINQGLNFVWVNGYNPRHIQFSGWMSDGDMLDYLRKNNQFIFLAQEAIKDAPQGLARITQAGLVNQVAEVEDPQGQLNLPSTWGSGLKPETPSLQYDRLEGTLDDGLGRSSAYHLDGDMIVYQMFLPSGFPDHLATSWFMPEAGRLRFLVEGAGGWQEFQAAQGALLRPHTFDVQNIKAGQLQAAFAKDDFPMRHRCVLLYPAQTNEGVTAVFAKQFDNLGLVFNAQHSGWLVLHDPYDPKFKISVDGKDTPFYKTNQSFIGFPLSAGVHKILISYWPHCLLRILLLISAVLITIGLPLLIVLALRWEQRGIDA